MCNDFARSMAITLFPMNALSGEPDVLASLLAAPGAAMLDGWGGGSAWRTILPWPEEIVELRWGASENWLEQLRGLDESTPRLEVQIPVPFSGGWLGYVAYDLGARLHDVPRYDRDAVEHPFFFAKHRRAILISDDGTTFLCCEDSEIERARKDLDVLLRRKPKQHATDSGGDLVAGIDASDYRRRVELIRALIRDGEVYQVNLTRSFRITGTVDPLELHLALLGDEPPHCSAFMNCGSWSVASASPETFLTFDRRTGVATSRPIKGTLRRTSSPAKDHARLLGSRKDAAEHLMIVDLVRNDLGKVAPPGNVRVTGFRSVLELRHVLHLESEIDARGLEDVPFDLLFSSLFPAGSITGAPKHAAVKAIRELEPESRGVYTGAIGFFDQSGRSEWSVAIRTAVVSPFEARYHAGGGVVWESDAAAEEEETLDKARAFLLFHEASKRPSW